MRVGDVGPSERFDADIVKSPPHASRQGRVVADLRGGTRPASFLRHALDARPTSAVPGVGMTTAHVVSVLGGHGVPGMM